VDVRLVFRIRWVSHVVDEDATYALRGDEGIRALTDLADGQSFWLWTLVIGAIIKFWAFIIGIVMEYARLIQRGGDFLKVRTRIEDDIAGGIVDGERTRAVCVELVEALFFFIPAGGIGQLKVSGYLFIRQFFEVGITQCAVADLAFVDDIGQFHLIGINPGAALILINAPLTCVTFIGGGEIGLAIGGKSMDGIRHA